MVEIVVRIILIIFFVIYSFLIPFRKKQKENIIIVVERRNIEDAQNVHDKNILDLTEQKYLYLKNKHNSPSLILDCYKFRIIFWQTYRLYFFWFFFIKSWNNNISIFAFF